VKGFADRANAMERYESVLEKQDDADDEEIT
jgi:hypothetical protein